MKAFVAVLLVASVAAQSPLESWKLNKELDLLKYHPRSLLKQQWNLNPVEKLEKEALLEKLENIDTPLRERFNDVTVLSVEELLRTELFQEYLNIPLFRQFWEYPSFRQYVTSHLFQKFWTHPIFKQYFRNPYLFYKFVYPQVQIFVHLREQMGLPVELPVERNILNKFLNLDDEFEVEPHNTFYNKMHSIYPWTRYMNKRMFPTTTSEFDTTFKYPTTHHNYKFLLDSIYKHLLINKPHEITEVKTDLKVKTPATVEEKIIKINPITGEKKLIEDLKVVENKVVPIPVPEMETIPEIFSEKMEKPFEKEMLKEVLLKKMLLNKFGMENKWAPETEEKVFPWSDEEYTIRNRRHSPLIKVGDEWIINPMFEKELLLKKELMGENTFEKTPFENTWWNKEIYPKHHMFNKEFTIPKELIIKNLLKKEFLKKEFLNKEFLNKEFLNKDIFDKEYFPETYEPKMEMLKELIKDKYTTVPLTYTKPIGMSTLDKYIFPENKY